MGDCGGREGSEGGAICMFEQERTGQRLIEPVKTK